MKICTKCKIEKDLSKFSKDKSRKDGLSYVCKECENKRNKKYHKANKEKINERQKDYHKNNKEQINERHKKTNKIYYKSKANYNTFAFQISYADKVKNINGFLQVKCTYCGKWYFPTNRSVQDRIQALNGQTNSDGVENRLYCSEECKKTCSIYGKQKYQVGHPKLDENNQTREVQPELRQLVFERDEYTCIKCGKHQDDLNVSLHCHHIEGIQQNPIESADVDMCVTVCKTCHKKIHQEKDCNYFDMRCNN